MMKKQLDRFELMKSIRRGNRHPTIIEEGQRGKIKYTRKYKYNKGWEHNED